MSSKQAQRRKLAKLKAELYSNPWAMEARALGALANQIEQGDLDAVKATLSLGRDAADSITKFVNGIAIIPVTGVLRDEVDFMVRFGMASSYQLIERDFNQAMENAQVKGILFYHNSPGGSAIGCKRVADTILDARGEKPIRAFVQGMCASASYYLAAATDRIESTADSLVGSIGTIFPHQEMSGMLQEIGVGVNVFTNTDSPKKGHGNMFEPLSEESRKTLQDFVNSYGRPFIEDVARYRGISAEEVIESFGKGDALRADKAVTANVVDAIVGSFEESLESISSGNVAESPIEREKQPPMEADNSVTRRDVMNERIKAQLFALGLIDSLDATDKECQAAMNAWFRSRGEDVPKDEVVCLSALQRIVKAQEEDPEEEEDDDEAEEKGKDKEAKSKAVQKAHNQEQAEARLENLTASAELFNEAIGYEAITSKMVLEAATAKLSAPEATKKWKDILAEKEKALPMDKVKITGEGADRFADAAIDALVYRAASGLKETKEPLQLSSEAEQLVNKPLKAIFAKALQLSGRKDIEGYENGEYLAEEGMQMGYQGSRHTFYSQNESRQYIQAASSPNLRPGDVPNILSGLANKFLDTVQLDDDYSYPQISALLPGGLNDFKPALMINKGIVEELDEVQDAEQFKELGLNEEVLSYIFMRRFGNKFGWTPVMIASDDLGAFVEGMLGLQEAWQVTQNRLVLDRLTANENLLDGNALFSDRADTGVGTNPAANDNNRTSGNPPSDTEWGAMEALYADIGGINTGRRVRGTLNVALVPTGSVAQEARRTFLPLNAGGLEMKVANTTSNVGLYRGEVQVIPESELRVNDKEVWYGLRNPTRLNTATIVRAYFNGFGTAGRRERWYDPTNKTTWVSIEGRIAVAVKNWRYAIRNAGTGA